MSQYTSVSRANVQYMHMLILLIFRLTAFQLQLVLLLVVLPPFVPTQQHGSAAHHSCTQKLPEPWNLQQQTHNMRNHSLDLCALEKHFLRC
jgi:hypothetical protein